jgi:hypothetical protein
MTSAGARKEHPMPGFEGDIWAIPKGTVVFGSEPLLRVSGPFMQAQLVETYRLHCDLCGKREKRACPQKRHSTCKRV